VAERLIFAVDALDDCAAADADGTGTVTAADIVAIVSAIVGNVPGCRSMAQSTWTTLAPLPGGPRQEIAAAAIGDTIYVLGGFDDGGRGTARVERYDVQTDRWTRAADLPMAVNHAGAGVVGQQLYAIGGFTGSSFQPTAAVFRYDAAGDAWTPVSALPSARGALAVVSLAGRLHALGGSGPASLTTHSVYDPAADAWTDLAPLPGVGRNHLAAVELDGFVYAVGGRRDGGGQANVDALVRYDPAADTWTALAPLPTARSGIGAAVLHGRIVVMGGEVDPMAPSGVFPHVEMYDPATDSWMRLADMPVPRHGIWAVSIGPRIYVPGGATAAGFAATAHHDALEIGL